MAAQTPNWAVLSRSARFVTSRLPVNGSPVMQPVNRIILPARSTYKHWDKINVLSQTVILIQCSKYSYAGYKILPANCSSYTIPAPLGGLNNPYTSNNRSTHSRVNGKGHHDSMWSEREKGKRQRVRKHMAQGQSWSIVLRSLFTLNLSKRGPPAS